MDINIINNNNALKIYTSFPLPSPSLPLHHPQVVVEHLLNPHLSRLLADPHQLLLLLLQVHY